MIVHGCGCHAGSCPPGFCPMQAAPGVTHLAVTVECSSGCIAPKSLGWDLGVLAKLHGVWWVRRVCDLLCYVGAGARSPAVGWSTLIPALGIHRSSRPSLLSWRLTQLTACFARNLRKRGVLLGLLQSRGCAGPARTFAGCLLVGRVHQASVRAVGLTVSRALFQHPGSSGPVGDWAPCTGASEG